MSHLKDPALKHKSESITLEKLRKMRKLGTYDHLMPFNQVNRLVLKKLSRISCISRKACTVQWLGINCKQIIFFVRLTILLINCFITIGLKYYFYSNDWRPLKRMVRTLSNITKVLFANMVHHFSR